MKEPLDIEEVYTDLPGYMFRPKKKGKYPGIIFVHGSGGGSNNFINVPDAPPRPTGKEAKFVKMAINYAQKGYATLALSYFDFETTRSLSIVPPPELIRVDIKNITEHVLSTMRAFDFVNEHSVGIYGNSRGAEHVLILASMARKSSKGSPDYVVALSPTAYIWNGISKDTADKYKRGEEIDWPIFPAWSYDQIDITDEHIAFEAIDIPFFISCFRQDTVWKTEKDYADIKSYLKKHKKAFIELEWLSAMQDPCLPAVHRGNNILLDIPLEGHCYPDSVLYSHEAKVLDEVIAQFIFTQSSAPF